MVPAGEIYLEDRSGPTKPFSTHGPPLPSQFAGPQKGKRLRMQAHVGSRLKRPSCRKSSQGIPC